MPPLFAEPEFYVAIAAVVFVAVVWKRGVKTVLGGLDARAERIRAELEQARDLVTAAERLLADYRSRQRDAASEAEAIIAHARAEAERIARQAAQDLEEALARRRGFAEERIAQEEARARAEIRAAAVDIAIAAARRVIADRLDEARGGALIDAAIAALPQRLP
jgi:F-type H+-transporting ATPase subunit b